MILYEKNRFGNENTFLIGHCENREMVLHFHRCFEFMYLEEGELSITLNDCEGILYKGQGALIFPNQLHAYHTKEYSKTTMFIFSPELVAHFTNFIRNKTASSHLFQADGLDLSSIRTDDNIFSIKSNLYRICGEFFSSVTLTEARSRDIQRNTLLHDILMYIEDHYTEHLMLQDLSRKIGYDYRYMSKYFLKKVGIPFNEYVNRCRINQACYLLENSENTITEISEKCGFNTLRSFNRNFQILVDTSPSEYRKNILGIEKYNRPG
ncbi:MAG TPA: hypothetical protein DD727_06460 [Clostridiales bacterium]|nr:hypothetical protein [Clostridiales bacterium]